MKSMNEKLTHIDEHGRARMVDVGSKPPVRRTAVAEGFFCAASGTLDRLEAGELPKGEGLAVARATGNKVAIKWLSAKLRAASRPRDSRGRFIKRERK